MYMLSTESCTFVVLRPERRGFAFCAFARLAMPQIAPGAEADIGRVMGRSWEGQQALHLRLTALG